MLRAQRVWASRLQRQVAVVCARSEANNAVRHQANSIGTRWSSTLVSSASLRARNSLITSQRRWQSIVVEPLEGDQVRQKYVEILRANCESGDYREALRALDEIEHANLTLDAEMYELTVGACARSGKVEVFGGLLKNMKKDHVVATTRSMDFLTQAYLAQENWSPMLQHLLIESERGTSLSDAAFQSGMEACGVQKDAQNAVKLLQHHLQTCDTAVGPDIFASVIRACGMSRRVDLANHVYNSMLAAGVVPNAEVLEQMIRSFIMNDQPREAIKIFANYKNEFPHLTLKEGIYTATIDSLVKKKEHFMAMRMFDRMHDHGVKPSFYCYGRILVALTRMKKEDEAIKLWQHVVQELPDEISTGRCTFLLKGLGYYGGNTVTLHIFNFLRETTQTESLPVLPVATYTTAIRAHGRMGEPEQAMELFDELVDLYSDRRITAPGPFLAAFNALSRDSHREPALIVRDAKRVWSEMVKNMRKILVPAYASAAGVFSSCGDMKSLQYLLQHADDNLHLDATLSIDEDENEFGHELDHFQDNDEDSNNYLYADPRQILYNGVISGFNKARSDCTAQIDEMLDMITEKNIAITDPMVRAASSAFVEYERWDLMEKLLAGINIEALSNAELSVGDLVSRLLEAKQWGMASDLLAVAHRYRLSLPIRRKSTILAELREGKLREWRIAYALALETLHFRKLIVENIESITDAAEVCLLAKRVDLALTLFEQTDRRKLPFAIPLRFYKVMLKGLLQKHTHDEEQFAEQVAQADRLCVQMLRKHQQDLDDEALSIAISIKAFQRDDAEVIALFETMLQHSFTPNSYAFKAAIMAYSRAKMLDRVEELRDLLLNNDPSSLEDDALEKLRESIIFSFALSKDHERVQETAELMSSDSRNLVVDAYLCTRQVEKAVQFLDPKLVSLDRWMAVLETITKYNRMAAASEKGFVTNKLPPSVTATALEKFVTSFGVSVVGGHVDLVIENCNLLVAMGEYTKAINLVKPLLTLQSQLLRKKKNSTQLQEQVQQMADMLLFCYGEKQDSANLVQLFANQERAGYKVDTANHYQAAMQYCFDSGAFVDCLTLLEMLRNKGVCPSGEMYLMGLQCCLKLNQQSATLKILDDLKREGFENYLISQLFKMWHKWINQYTRQKKQSQQVDDDQSSSQLLQSTLRSASTAHMTEIESLVMLMLSCHRRGFVVPATLFKQIEEAGFPGLSAELVGELQMQIAKAPRFSHLAGRRGPREPHSHRPMRRSSSF